MADLDDFDRAASAFPDLDDFSGAPAPSGSATSFPALDGDDDFVSAFGETPAPSSFSAIIPASAKPTTDVKVTGDDLIDSFENQFPDLGPETSYTSPPAVSAQPSFYQTPPVPQPSYGGPIYPIQQEEEEPEVIKKWRADQEERIRDRDEASEKKRQVTIGKAENDIDQFYKEYNAKKERNIAENKKNEEEYKASLTDALAAGTTWDRICDLVELQNSQSKTLARAGPGTSDLTRMKEVLLRLRREGDNAPGASGY